MGGQAAPAAVVFLTVHGHAGAGPLTETVSMNTDHILALAKQFRALPDAMTGKPSLAKEEAAGRKLAEAMDAGAWAWAWPEELADIRRETLDAGHGYAGFWILALQDWLQTLNRHHQGIVGTHTPPDPFKFRADCDTIAAGLEAVAATPVDEATPPEATNGRKGRLPKDESDARRSYMFALLKDNPRLIDTPAELARLVDVGKSTVLRWYEEERKNEAELAAHRRTQNGEE